MPTRFSVSFALAAVVFFAPYTIQAQDSASSSALFTALSGHWACNGGFRDGRSLSADLTFQPVQNGRALRFSHADRVPGTYWQEATWVFDGKGRRVFSLAATGATSSSVAAAAMFSAREWSFAVGCGRSATLTKRPEMLAGARNVA
ncbi:MAG: hypothetical protein ABJE47_17835 [bacterium]